MNTLGPSFEIYPHRTISLELYLLVSSFYLPSCRKCICLDCISV